MQDYRQVYFRDFLFERPILQNGEFKCLWIHDTCDNSLQGYSAGESDDFCKATYIVENTSGKTFMQKVSYLHHDMHENEIALFAQHYRVARGRL